MSTTRVLLVDDNVDLAENIKEILEDEGVEAEVVSGGQAALDRLGEQQFHLVVTDVRMPDIDGLEVLRRIHARWPTLPVIVMTAYDSDSVVDEAHAQGALGVLPKPLDFGRLVGLVASITPPSAPLLLVEDDRELRVNLTEAFVEESNAVVHAVGDIESAWRLARDRPFAVAVIDARLPDGDGISLGAELQRLYEGAIEIVYITGYAEQFRHELDGLLEQPHIQLLEKPFRPDRLLALVQKTL